MSDSERERFRKRYFPVDVAFPEHRPFGGILGGLPEGAADEKRADGETTTGGIYFGPYTDQRRLPDEGDEGEADD